MRSRKGAPSRSMTMLRWSRGFTNLYQSSLRVTDDCPIAVGNGHDLPRLIGESVPGVAAVVDDVVEGFEDAVRKPVLAHELPDIFLAVELGCARWQWQERDVARNPEIFRAVPAGLIEDENGMRAGGDLRGDLLEMKLHSFAVAGRQHERGARSALGANRAEQVGRLGALIVDGTGSRALPGPAIGELVFLPDPHLVLEPYLYRCVRREPRSDFRHALDEVFLTATTATGACSQPFALPSTAGNRKSLR